MGSIPGLRRSPGGGNGKPLLSFPGAQLVKKKTKTKTKTKKLHAMQETLVRFLGWEDPPEKG